MIITLNTFLIALAIFFAVISLSSGAYFVFSSFLRFRKEVTRAMNMELEMVRVAKPHYKDQARETPEEWKEEVGAMEQLFSALGTIKNKSSFFKKMLYGDPVIVLEMAVSSKEEEIGFYISFPRKFKENIEKQIHGFFPNAAIEVIEDYNIFSPGSVAAASVLTLKNKPALPIRT